MTTTTAPKWKRRPYSYGACQHTCTGGNRCVATDVKICYNTGVNHIKSSGALTRHRYPFSNRNRGADTMIDHTPTPYFPENPEDYAPWVAIHGLYAPYGKCQCGCGHDAGISTSTVFARGWRNGHPRRFLRGHSMDKYHRAEHPNPSGLCMCGCGQPAPISKVTRNKSGYVKGLPIRYIPGHGNRIVEQMDEPNPSGLCMCGCGQPAPIAKETNRAQGHMAGKPTRFIHNHHHNLEPSPEERFWANVNRAGPDDCWEWQLSTSRVGHGRLNWYGRNTSAHRVAYELTVGPIPDGLYVCHHCDNPPCCNPAHLFLGTPKDNTQDMVAKNRHVYGERSKSAKLTENDVLEILSLLDEGWSFSRIALLYQVTDGAIRHIAKGNTWRHVTLRLSGTGVNEKARRW